MHVDSAATDVTLRNLTVANTFDEAAHPEITDQQAVALRVEGDRFVGNRIRLIGNQDTLLADTPKPTTRIRQYYVDSYIEGDVDYVFGAANAVFDRVTLRSLDRCEVEQRLRHRREHRYGQQVRLPDLGLQDRQRRRRRHRQPRPSVASVSRRERTGFRRLHEHLAAGALDVAAPWEDMATRNSSGVPVLFPWTTGRFFESDNVGPGATANEMRPRLTRRKPQSSRLRRKFLGKDGWSPVLAAADAPPAAPANLVASTDVRLVNLAWDDDESASVIGWNVYRADAAGAFAKVGAIYTASYSDTTVTTVSSYRYVVTADDSPRASRPRRAPSLRHRRRRCHCDRHHRRPGRRGDRNDFKTLAAALAAAPAGTSTDPTVIASLRVATRSTTRSPRPTRSGRRRHRHRASAVVITGNRAAGTPTGQNDRRHSPPRTAPPAAPASSSPRRTCDSHEPDSRERLRRGHLRSTARPSPCAPPVTASSSTTCGCSATRTPSTPTATRHLDLSASTSTTASSRVTSTSSSAARTVVIDRQHPPGPRPRHLAQRRGHRGQHVGARSSAS